MALATRCPYCHTTFRVASDQLKLRGGIVRCGACQRIFDGQAHLVDLDAIAAARPADESPTPPGHVPDAAAPSALPVLPEPPAAHPAEADIDDDEDRPVYTLDFGHTLDPLGILPDAGEFADDAETGPAPAEVRPADAAIPDAHAREDAGSPRLDPADAPVDASMAIAGLSGRDALPAGPDPEDAIPDAARPAPQTEPDRADAHTPAHEALEGDADADAGIVPHPQDVEPHVTPPPDAPPDLSPAPDNLTDTGTPAQEDTPAQYPTRDTHPAVAHERGHEAGPFAPADIVPVPTARIEPTFHLPVDEELVAQALPDADPDPGHAPGRPAPNAIDAAAPASSGHQPADADRYDATPAVLPLRASADADVSAASARVEPALSAPTSARARSAEARARRSALTPTRIEAPRLRVPAAAQADEPEFVKRSRRRERAGKSVRLALALGIAALLLLLAAQMVLSLRNELAARRPGLRPALAAACGLLGCRVDWPAHAENLVIDEGDLAPIGQDAYALNTALHNQGGVTQAWPSIELELVDAAHKPVLRRVFGPAEYLPPGTRLDAGFGARSELPVKLNFTLAGIAPSSYNIVVFYP